MGPKSTDSQQALKEKIKELEYELSTTKYNKRTQHHIGLVKAKIARLKEKLEQRAKKPARTRGFAVKKSGDATVVIIGYPSVGKSTLINKLTNAKSPVAGYAFTTISVIPGLMKYKSVSIQLLDVPGVVEGASAGYGRGKGALGIIRNADLLLILIDSAQQLAILRNELYAAGIRLNQREPDVKITKTARGGIVVGSIVKLTQLTEKTVVDILKEFRINNAQVVIREDISADQLIDVVKGNRKYLTNITVVNKADLLSEQQKTNLKKWINYDLLISAKNDVNLSALRELIYERLELIRVFCKEVGRKAEMEVPLVLKKGSTVSDMCTKLHRDFLNRFRYAKVWGSSAKFDGQQLGVRHQLHDNDIVEIHLS